LTSGLGTPRVCCGPSPSLRGYERHRASIGLAEDPQLELLSREFDVDA
jgi:hypothetical protein